LFGLMRVRSMQMNDAHIYTSEELFEQEFMGVIDLYKQYFHLFGIDRYVMRFSLHGKDGLGKKYIDNERLWLKTEDMVRNAMKNGNVPFVEASNEAAFYGPKIDVQIWSVIGKEFTLATNQVDFAQPARFNLTYVNKDGVEETPLCIHRAPLSTHERMIGFLLEHYAGNFPVWLAPVQVEVIPIAERHNEYAQKLVSQVNARGLRAQADLRREKLGYKIREAEKNKIPFILVVGDKEAEAGTASLRIHGQGDKGAVPVAEFLDKAKALDDRRSLTIAY